MKRIIESLKENGPLLSGELSRALMQDYNLSSEASRKIISRASLPIKKFDGIIFDSNQKFVYLDAHLKNKNTYYQKLFEKIKDFSKTYYSFIQALLFHNGFINIKLFPTYTFSPIKKLTGHKLASRILEDLLTSGLVSIYDDNIIQLNQCFYNVVTRRNPDYRRFDAIELSNEIVMFHFKEWARNINLASYESTKILTEIPEFFKFQWSFTSPSYVLSKGQEKNISFIVADILIGRQLTTDDIEYFVKKVDILKHSSNNLTPFMPILIAEEIELKAFQLLKSKGILLGFIHQIFGQQYAEMLKALIQIIKNFPEVIEKDSESFTRLLDTIKQMKLKMGNMIGKLFEYAVGEYYYRYVGKFELNINVKDPDSSAKGEIDVFVNSSPTEIIIVECKAYGQPIKEEETKKWLTEKIPLIRKWILNQDRYKDKNLRFELWCSGGFDEDSLKQLKKMASEVKKYKIQYYDKEEILKKARESKHDNLKKVIEMIFPRNQIN